MKSIAFELSIIVLVAYFAASIGVTIIKTSARAHHHTVCERHAHSR